MEPIILLMKEKLLPDFYYFCNKKLMPAISMFYGIIVYLYYLDTKQHNLPHIHVMYQDMEAIISIPDGLILEGFLPANKLKLVEAWIEIHKEELLADWKLAAKGEPVFKIEPLK